MKRTPWPCVLLLAAGPAGLCEGAITVTTAQSSSPFAVSSTDLGQSAGTTYAGAGTGGSELPTQAAQLFNGQAGNTDGDASDPGEVVVTTDSSVTVNLDTSVHAMGYDITGITTLFGWNTGQNGRSNQGYSITLTYVDDLTATLVEATHWEPNSPANYWTRVNFSNSDGGALFSDTLGLNGGGATTGTGVLASGVKAITFSGFFPANAGGVTVAREFDIEGVATVPEPGCALLGIPALLALLRRRRA